MTKKKVINGKTYRRRRGKLVEVPPEWLGDYGKHPRYYVPSIWPKLRVSILRRRKHGLYKLKWPKVTFLRNKYRKLEMIQEIEESKFARSDYNRSH